MKIGAQRPVQTINDRSSPVGIIWDSLDKAAANTATRPIPKSAGAQIRFLVKHEKGSTRIVAQRLGISQRTVERYLKGQIRTPRPELAAKLAAEVRKDWQPRVRERAKRQAATSTGIVIETRARFGFTAAPGSTDDGRIRRVTQQLPPQYAARLFDARLLVLRSSSCRTSPPKASRSSTSRTVAAAPTASSWSSPTSTT